MVFHFRFVLIQDFNLHKKEKIIAWQQLNSPRHLQVIYLGKTIFGPSPLADNTYIWASAETLAERVIKIKTITKT